MLGTEGWFGGGACEECWAEESPLELDAEVRYCCASDEKIFLHHSGVSQMIDVFDSILGIH